MSKFKAFTLIEVMVVLSILAIIAILAYNFFGNVMHESRVSSAATEIYTNLNRLADGRDLYIQKTGNDMPNFDENGDALVAVGILKSHLSQPGGPPRLAVSNYWYGAYNFNNGGLTVAVDGYVYFGYQNTTSSGVYADICAHYNNLYTGLGSTVPTAYEYNQAAYCYRTGGGPYSYWFVLYTDPQ